MKKFFSDFKAFALKTLSTWRSVLSSAAHSAKLFSSLVADIISPLINLATGKGNAYRFKMGDQSGSHRCRRKRYPSRNCSHIRQFSSKHRFFLIIAFSIFVVIRLMMKAQEKMESLTKKEKEEEKKEEAPAEEKEEETELAILKEIRDLMKKGIIFLL